MTTPKNFDAETFYRWLWPLQDWHAPQAKTGIAACLCVLGAGKCGCFRDYEDCLGHAKFLNPDLNVLNDPDAKTFADMINGALAIGISLELMAAGPTFIGTVENAGATYSFNGYGTTAVSALKDGLWKLCKRERGIE